MKKLIIMKNSITVLVLALVAAFPLAAYCQPDLDKDPAYLPIDKFLDLQSVHPQVNVNLPRFLLKDVTSSLDASNTLAKSGIDLADLVKDVKLIRVVVVDVSETNRTEVDKAVKKLKGELQSKWTPIVVVPEDNVNIYAMGDASGEAMSGLGLLIYNDGDLVIANVVGHVSIGKLLSIASQKNKLPKDFLKNLLGNGGGASTPQATKTDGADGGGATNAPAAESNEPANK